MSDDPSEIEQLSAAEIDDIRWLARRVKEQGASAGYDDQWARDNARAERVEAALCRIEHDEYTEQPPTLSPERIRQNERIIAENIEREKALPASLTSWELERLQ